jgi:hypothetical protein
MRRLLWLAAVLCSALISACSEKPEGAPPTAKRPIEASVEGLSGAFTRECIEHRDFRWAQEESKRMVATCGGFLVGDGERGDCEQSVEGDVSWLVPTTPKSTVLIQMFWGENSAKVTCSVSVSPDIADTLKQAASQVANSLSLVSRPPNEPGDLIWAQADGHGDHALILHQLSPGQFRNLPSFDTKGQWAAYNLASQRSHPYQLEYRPYRPLSAPTAAPCRREIRGPLQYILSSALHVGGPHAQAR